MNYVRFLGIFNQYDFFPLLYFEEELSEVKWFNIDDVIEMIKNHDNIVFTENRIKLFEGLKNV